jgi:small subunit ribosomal protein S2
MEQEAQNNLSDLPKADLKLVEQMVKEGVHFGHSATKWNPKMEPFIFGSKNNVHLIDLEKTVEMLKKAKEFAKDVVRKGGKVLFVGTTPAAKRVIEECVTQTGMPFVSERWLGGTLTNFKIIAKRLEYFKELERKQAAGELEKYTKKERQEFNEEIKKLERKFGGFKNLQKIPEALFVLDSKKNYLAIKEARDSGKVKTIALCDTNVDPDSIDYPIPANDDAISSLRLITGQIVEAIEEGKKDAGKAAEEKK